VESLDEDDDELRIDMWQTPVPPTALFTLLDDDVIFGLRRSPTTDKLLDELPMYGAPLFVPGSPSSKQDFDPDRFWKKPALPLSKYVEGRMELKFDRILPKKSRYICEEESDDEEEIAFGGQRQPKVVLPPASTAVALFNPEHGHIRDRIHAGHQFRPPSEFPMPLQPFFECRQASQWTLEEDDTLKEHVREYSYNWSLISNLLTTKSLFASGAERRTPWECFERWVCLEGLPTDMQKTAYFRAWNKRMEDAARNVAAQIPQQANAQGQIQPPPRRRTTQSVRVEKRRNNKHLAMIDAFRKLAKKRENTIQKQAQAAGLAAMRKQVEVAPGQRGPLKTPQELSKIKFEQQERQMEQIRLLQQRQLIQQQQARV